MLSSTSDSTSLTVKLRPRQRAWGESSLCWCLPLQRRGAAEWDQRKPGLTPPTLCLTSGSGGAGKVRLGRSPASHSRGLFIRLLSEGASQTFQSFKELFFPEWLCWAATGRSWLGWEGQGAGETGDSWAGRLRNSFHWLPALKRKTWYFRCLLFSDLKYRSTVWKLLSVCRNHNHTHNSIFLGCAICDATTCNLEKSLPGRIKIYMLAKNASSD